MAKRLVHPFKIKAQERYLLHKHRNKQQQQHFNKP